MSSNIVLPEGWHDAKGAILAVAILGEALQGELLSAWLHSLLSWGAGDQEVEANTAPLIVWVRGG